MRPRRPRQPDPGPTPPSVQDAYDLHRARFAVYLDQARWLYDQESRRSAGFQQTAVALAGFDGVVLAILASNDMLTNRSASWIAVAGAFCLILSAAAAVGVLLPKPLPTAGIDLVVEGWEALHLGAPDQDVQHFAAMLLVADPSSEAPRTRRERRAARREERAARRREKKGLEPLSKQPLAALERLADTRGQRVRWSASLLILGLAFLGASITMTATGDPDTPAATSSSPAPHESRSVT